MYLRAQFLLTLCLLTGMLPDVTTTLCLFFIFVTHKLKAVYTITRHVTSRDVTHSINVLLHEKTVAIHFIMRNNTNHIIQRINAPTGVYSNMEFVVLRSHGKYAWKVTKCNSDQGQKQHTVLYNLDYTWALAMFPIYIRGKGSCSEPQSFV